MLWYLPQEDDEDVMREIEEYVLAACALDTWLVEHPPQFEWLMRHPGMFTLVGMSCRRRWSGLGGPTGEALPPPGPQYPVNFGASMEELARARGDPLDRLRARRPPGRARAGRVCRGRGGLPRRKASPAGAWTGARSTSGGLNGWIQTGSTIIFKPYTLEEAPLGEAAAENVEIGAVKGFLEHLDPTRSRMPSSRTPAGCSTRTGCAWSR